MKAKETWRKNDKRISQLKAVDKELVKAKDEVFKIATSSPKDLAAYFEKKTKQLINAKSFNSTDKTAKYVDIVQDVINLLPIHWISQEIVSTPSTFYFVRFILTLLSVRLACR